MTPHNWAADNAIINIISAVPWEIVPTDPKEEKSAKQEGKTPKELECDAVTSWFKNCNINGDGFDRLLKMALWDVLQIDSGVFNKIFNRKGEMTEIYVKDGGTFTKNPDQFGTFSGRADIVDINYAYTIFGRDTPPFKNWMTEKPAYFQYGWITGARPMPFGRRELVWLEMNPRPDSIYGRSATEILMNTLQMLVYGVDYNLEYYTDNSIPKGVLMAEGADSEWIDSFRKQWDQQMKVKNEVGDWRRRFHNLPIIGTKGEFIRVQFSNAELELINQQAWFSKLVWACKGIAPSELGMDDHPTKAHQIAQSEAVKRRIIRPLLQTIQQRINSEMISEFEKGVRMHPNHPDKGKLVKAKDIKFQFNLEDIGEDTKKIVLMGMEIRSGIKTANEVREEMGLSPHPDGDKLRTSSGVSGMFGRPEEGISSEESGTSKDSIGEQKAHPHGKHSCECPSCGRKITLNAGEKCSEKKCPDCGDRMRATEAGEFQKAMTGNPYDNPLMFKPGERPTPKKVEDALEYILNDAEKRITAELRKQEGIDTLKNIKAVDRNLVDRLKGFLNLNQSEDVVRHVIEASFLKALDDAGKEIGNIFQVDKGAIDFLKSHALDRVSDLDTELKNDIKAELERGMLNGEGIPKLVARVRDVFDTGKNRATMISRTEVLRASNEGLLDGYKQSGIKGKKQWVAKMDDRTSDLCRRLNGQTVGLNDNFVDPDGKWEGKAPPGHVQCRSRIIFVPEGEHG